MNAELQYPFIAIVTDKVFNRSTKTLLLHFLNQQYFSECIDTKIDLYDSSLDF